MSSHSSAITSIRFWHQAMRWEEVRCLKTWLTWLNGRVPSMDQSAWRRKWEDNNKCVSSVFFSFFGSVVCSCAGVQCSFQFEWWNADVLTAFWTQKIENKSSYHRVWCGELPCPVTVSDTCGVKNCGVDIVTWKQEAFTTTGKLFLDPMESTFKSVVKSLAASQHPLSFCLLFRSLATFSQCFQRQKASR